MKKSILLIAFLLTLFSVYAQFNSSSFAAPVGFTVFSSAQGSINLASADLDNDGRIDVAVINQSNGTLSIFKNIGSQGIINSSTFATKIDIVIGSTSNTLNYLKFAKLDNDNRIDLVISTGSGNSMAILKNTSDTVSGAISFATPVLYSAQSNTVGVDVADLDGDGKQDVVIANYGSSSFTAFLNTTSGSTPSFTSSGSYTTGLSNPNQLLLADLDGDNKKDVVLFNFGNNITRIYRNTSSLGTINFTYVSLTLTGNSGVFRGDIGDIDGDGKPEIIASSYSSGSTSLYRNTSTLGTINFDAQVFFTGPYAIQSSRLCDFNRDGKLEILQSCGGSPNAITVRENFATPSTSLSAEVIPTAATYTVSGNGPTGLDFADIDRDGKTDLLCVTFGSPTTLFVMRNLTADPTGLMGFYPFDNNNTDNSGYNNTISPGLPSGNAYTTNRFGTPTTALSYDGTISAGIAAPAAAQINPKTMKNLTLTVWCKVGPGTTTNNMRSLLVFNDASSNQFALSLDQVTRKLKFSNNNGSISNVYWMAESKSSLSVNLWYHVALRFDSTNAVSFFINGALDTTVQRSPAIIPAYPQMHIGRNPLNSPNSYAWLGQIDDVKVFRKALTPAQILAMFDYYSFYYSKSTGPLNLLSTWGPNPDGSGLAPTSFFSANTFWQVTNNSSPTLTADWSVAGTNTGIMVNGGYNLVIPSGMNLGTDSLILLDNGTLTVHGNLFTNKTYFDTLSTVQYLGTQAQTLYGNNFFNLTLMGSEKVMSSSITVRNYLTLASSLNTGAHTVTVGTSGTQTGTVNLFGGYIKGKLCKWVNPTTGNLIVNLPIGTNTNYLPAQFEFSSSLGSAGTLTTQFVNAVPGNGGLPLFDFSIIPIVQLTKTAQNGYWQILAGNGLSMGSATYSVSLTGNNFYGISSVQALRVLTRSNSGSGPWTISGSAAINAGTAASPVVIRAYMNTFGDFVIGSDSTVNSMPVELLSFDAKTIENAIEVKWKTASEINHAYFLLQRSMDGITFGTIAKMEGTGNTHQIQEYVFNDFNLKGLEQGIYYRLIQVDMDGTETQSEIIRVQNLEDEIRFFPNPVRNHLTLRKEVFGVRVYDIFGVSYALPVEGKTLDMSSLAPGVYFLQAEGKSYRLVKE